MSEIFGGLVINLDYTKFDRLVVKDIQLDNFLIHDLKQFLSCIDKDSDGYRCILEILNKFSLAPIKYTSEVKKND